jgi:penicillin-binding protein 1A
MSDGQGASMALPVWALYMQKVYADESLGYSQEEKFNVPEDFNPCAQQMFVTDFAGEQLDDFFE